MRSLSRHAPAVLCMALLAALAGWSSPARGEQAPEYRTTRISYLTTRSVYIDGGSEDGIEVGQEVEVLRDSAVIATLRVTYVSSRRASCARDDSGVDLRIDDTVRFIPRGAVETSAALDPAPEAGGGPLQPGGGATRKSRSWAREFGLRGRIGVRYLTVRDKLNGNEGFSQPAVELRLDGRRLGGSPVDLQVDARSRRTYRTAADGTTESESLTRVYRLAAAVQGEDSPWRLSAGRQYSSSLAPVSIFDGGMGEFRRPRWSLGLFSGTQPDPEDFGQSGRVREHGGYVEWRNRELAKRRWSLTFGAVGSYEENEISREFSYLLCSYTGPRFSMYLTQEADLNRGWKADIEDEGIAMTSTFVNLRLRLSKPWTLNAGYDNRRSIRLYRDRTTPEIEFDDEYRQGIWGGVDLRLGGHFRAGLSARTSGRGVDAGGADSYTLVLGVDRMTRTALYIRSRSTRYINQRVEGWLHSVSTGLTLGRSWHAEVSGGIRDETNLTDPLLDDQITWYAMEIDLSLGRGWFMVTSAERSEGQNESIEQLYSSIAYRF